MSDIEKRFWSKVAIKNEKRCWLWNGGTDKDGYGIFWVNPRNQFAHRLAYIFEFGEFDKTLNVLHKCDNPSCVNPNHLFLGTHQDNMNDMVKKNRSLKGEKMYSAKLTECNVKKIKTLLKDNSISLAAIATQFKVSKSAILDIKMGRTWIHITL